LSGGVVSGVLALGLYASRNVRQVGVVATPTPQAVADALATGTAVPVVAATTPVAVPAPTLAPTPLIVVTLASPTPVPSAAAAGVTATVVPTAVENAGPTALPTVEPTLAAEVGQAYENFWRVRSQAALTLDPTRLPEVMDGPYLYQFADVLNRLKIEGRAIQTKVALNYSVIVANTDKAIIHDRVSDDSFYVRVGTEEPVSEPANDLLQLEVKLNNFGGTWKVVESVSAD
jgi:hypothetical protein